MNKIYVVGLGPGAGDQMTVQAKKVLDACPVIIGYTVYIDLVRPLFPEKPRIVVTIIKKNNRVKIRSGREEVFNAGISRLPVLLNFPITSFLRTF